MRLMPFAFTPSIPLLGAAWHLAGQGESPAIFIYVVLFWFLVILGVAIAAALATDILRSTKPSDQTTDD